MIFSKKKKQHIFVLQEGSIGPLNSEKEPEYFDSIVSPTESQAKNRESLNLTISSTKFRLALFFIFSIIFLFAGRAAHLQIIEGEHYRALADGNRIRSHVIVPPRGIVYDRDGNILIENIPSFVLTMTIADLPDEEEERSYVLNQIANLAGFQPAELDRLITKHSGTPFEKIPIKKSIDYEAAIRLSIEVTKLDGFDLDISSQRSYNTSAPSLSHVLGYVGKINEDEIEILKDKGYRPIDEVGKTGIEAAEETILRGITGKRTVEVDARGRELSVVAKEAPTPGSNLILSIDLELQQKIEHLLKDSFREANSSRGSIVAIDPRSGAVRAMVSLPTFDNNAFASGVDADYYNFLINDPDKPLFNRSISGEYPSGSTFKPIVAYAALAEGIIDEHTAFLSAGGLRISLWFFPDWRAGGHGLTTVRKAISESVNTFFYIIGGGYENITGLGVQKITDYARKFGFGEITNIGLPGESDGFLPSKEWKEEVKGERWYVGDTYHLAIGQGDLLATPIQIALSTAIIANGGNDLKPTFIEGIDGHMSYEREAFTNDLNLNQEAIQIVREGMRQTVTKGSARSMSALPIEVAGKTGTAQTPGNRPTHAWFIGFAPYDDPTLAIVILVEEGGEGSETAVPIAREIFQWWYDHGAQ